MKSGLLQSVWGCSAHEAVFLFPTPLSEATHIPARTLSPLHPLPGDFSSPTPRALDCWTLLPQPHLGNFSASQPERSGMNFLLASYSAPLSLDASGVSVSPAVSVSIWVSSFSFSLPRPPLASSSTHSPAQRGPWCAPRWGDAWAFWLGPSLPGRDVWASLTRQLRTRCESDRPGFESRHRMAASSWAWLPTHQGIF